MENNTECWPEMGEMRGLPWEIDELASAFKISLTITIASAAVVPCRSIVSLFPLLDLRCCLSNVAWETSNMCTYLLARTISLAPFSASSRAISWNSLAC